MQQQSPETPEFSRPLAVDLVGQEPLVKLISANADERAALAKRFGLLSLDKLEARLEISRDRLLTVIFVRGGFAADLAQACVVTLAPVAAHVAESFDLLYGVAPEDGAMGHPVEVLIDPDVADPPEPIGPDGVDLGEAVAQQLVLALDPYPRAEGADLAELEWAGSEPDDESAHPFAILRRLGRNG